MIFIIIFFLLETAFSYNGLDLKVTFYHIINQKFHQNGILKSSFFVFSNVFLSVRKNYRSQVARSSMYRKRNVYEVDFSWS